MATLARYPFARVDGIELSNDLANIARSNLQRLRVDKARIYCCDAAEFTSFDTYTYIYMYHPFPEIVMRPVVQNIVASLRRSPRSVYLIYKNPILNDIVVASGFKKVKDFPQSELTDRPFALYQWHSTETLCPL